MGGSGAYPSFYAPAEKLLTVIKQKLGLDACKFGLTGAAPITTDTLQYFGSLGIQINECYGMSECTGATTISLDDAHVWGSCGFEVPGAEVKVFKVDERDLNKKTEVPAAKDMFAATEEEQGEICFRGRHIMMGYMANASLGKAHEKKIQQKLDEAVDKEGWLHSGDKGCIDARGMVKITGRYKELIIGAGGENVAPVPMEDNIKRLHAGISNVMMVGDKQKYNVCVVSLKTKGATGEKPGSDDLDGGALDINPDVTTITQAKSDPTWIKSITDAITASNNDPSCCPINPAKIQKFTILPTDFSVETEELTPTLKLKRSVAEKKYAAAIAAMYKSKDVYVPC
jgi:long-chain-fatty-acid--CoA ligase ACSBG